MKIVIAPDKFKDSLSAVDVVQAMSRGVRGVVDDADIDACPMADGGEGTVAALVAATGGRIEKRTVVGPLPGMRVEAPIGLLGDGSTAVIEMASASGLHLVPPDKRNPMRTTTYGTGELLKAAAELGARRIILGIGGSATTDGGIGCVQGWGGKITLVNGGSYGAGDRVLVGADVENVTSVEIGGHMFAGSRRRTARPVRQASSRLLPSAREVVEFVVACDVGNPLYGENGAAVVFGPQKGAAPDEVRQLDAALRRLAERTTPELADAPGAGAAGGLGFGMLAFFAARMQSGIGIVIEATRLRQRLAGADLCLTGEGRFDNSSLSGKTVVGVARLCRELNVPCIALCGTVQVDEQAARQEGMTAWFSIVPGPMPLADALRDAAKLLEATTGNVMRVAAGPLPVARKAARAPGD